MRNNCSNFICWRIRLYSIIKCLLIISHYLTTLKPGQDINSVVEVLLYDLGWPHSLCSPCEYHPRDILEAVGDGARTVSRPSITKRSDGSWQSWGTVVWTWWMCGGHRCSKNLTTNLRPCGLLLVTLPVSWSISQMLVAYSK